MGRIHSRLRSASEIRAAAPAARALTALLVWCGFAAAAPAYGAGDFPPPLLPAQPDRNQTAAVPRPAAPEGAAPAPGADAAQGAWTPEPAPPRPQRDVQIEQKRIGRRVAEVIVTPAGFTYHYTMIHLDDQDPGTLLQPHPELSVPRFFRIDF
jgi:hypothetical protein